MVVVVVEGLKNTIELLDSYIGSLVWYLMVGMVLYSIGRIDCSGTREQSIMHLLQCPSRAEMFRSEPDRDGKRLFEV
ncbi:hypothetical protein EYC80_002685 [Monilinia laxa]|uniref:Uncharacterized protein n=1 Tax=Monilinia laxa TaxID=61186 RepID=A0A5N6K4N3_MONLA|nr:hypothetical protein EYC80_002685 [Monilinia laxa]